MRISDWSSDVCSSDLKRGGEIASWLDRYFCQTQEPGHLSQPIYQGGQRPVGVEGGFGVGASDPQEAGLAVGLEVDAGDQLAVVEEGEHVVAVHPLGLWHVDLDAVAEPEERLGAIPLPDERVERRQQGRRPHPAWELGVRVQVRRLLPALHRDRPQRAVVGQLRSEEHTSELQSLMRISYAVFCLTKTRK